MFSLISLWDRLGSYFGTRYLIDQSKLTCKPFN
jgi:hypothetical protein